MLFKKLQQLAQWVGFLAIAGLALYGLVNLGSGRLWAAGDESRPAAEDAPAITIPSSFNYQGVLRDGSGNLMNGTHKIRVALWTDVQTGSELYFEEFPSVAVRDGLFNVVMGSTKTLSPSYFQNVAPLFVGVSVDDGAELLPRQRIHPVPWALLATSAQSATTANTLVSGATVTNLRNNGQLSLNSSTNYLDTASDSVVNGIRFWANDGYAWIGNNQNLMTLSPTKGNNINQGLNVNGGVTTGGVKPVLIKQFINQPHGVWVDTGIPIATYNCTMGSWTIRMDINENATGSWFRYVERNATTGNWDAMSRSVVHTSTPTDVWFDVVCFHKDISVWSQQSAVSAASNPDGSPLQADAALDDTGQ